jgi:hypothetical protein
VRVGIQKLSGVESVTVSLEHASADVRLRPGNTITLSQLRTIIKNNGFTAKNATITAIGKIIERNGGPAVQISGIDTVLIVAADPRAPAALAGARDRMDRKDAADVQVVGTVETTTDATAERLRITEITAPSR